MELVLQELLEQNYNTGPGFKPIERMCPMMSNGNGMLPKQWLEYERDDPNNQKIDPDVFVKVNSASLFTFNSAGGMISTPNTQNTAGEANLQNFKINSNDEIKRDFLRVHERLYQPVNPTSDISGIRARPLDGWEHYMTEAGGHRLGKIEIEDYKRYDTQQASLPSFTRLRVNLKMTDSAVFGASKREGKNLGRNHGTFNAFKGLVFSIVVYLLTT